MARRSRHRGDPDERGPRRNVRRRERPHLDLVVGVRPVSEALRAGRREAHKLIWRDGAVRPRPAISALLELAERSGVATEALDPQEFEKRVASVGPTHQGVVLEAGPLPTLRLQEIQEAFAGAELLVALDGVEDPQNLGAIARVAVGAGVDGLVLPKRRSAPISSAVGRASAGAIEYLPVAVVPNLREALTRLEHDDHLGLKTIHRGRDGLKAVANPVKGRLEALPLPTRSGIPDLASASTSTIGLHRCWLRQNE